jgi:hypothetical protein
VEYSVFVKAQIQPNSGECDPHAVHYDSVPGLYVGCIMALTNTVVEYTSESNDTEQISADTGLQACWPPLGEEPATTMPCTCGVYVLISAKHWYDVVCNNGSRCQQCFALSHLLVQKGGRKC